MKRWLQFIVLLLAVLAPQVWGYTPSRGPVLRESSFDPVWNLADASGYSFCGGDPVNRFDADGRVGKAVGQFAADTSSSLGQLVCDAYYSIGYALVCPVSAQSAQRWYGGSAQRFAGTVAGTAQMIYDVAALASYGLFSPFAPEEAYNAYGGAIERLEQRLPVFYGGSGQSAAVTRPEPCLPTAPKTQLSLPAPKQPVALLPEAAESLAAKTGLTTPGNVPLGFTRVELPAGSFVNRVYDSSCVPGKSQLFGQSFCPGAGLPTDAAYAITTRGLNPALNNAQLGAVFRVSQNITVY